MSCRQHGGAGPKDYENCFECHQQKNGSKSMKFYSVSVPVHSHVSVYVEAENEEQAAEIASLAARLSDAESIDFSSDEPDVLEIEEDDIGYSCIIHQAEKKSRRNR